MGTGLSHSEVLYGRVKSLDALAEDTSSVPSTHVMWLTTISVSSYRGPNTSEGTHIRVPYGHIHICINKSFKVLYEHLILYIDVKLLKEVKTECRKQK